MMNEKTTAGPACDLATGPVITYTAKMIWLYNIMLVEKNGYCNRNIGYQISL